MVAELRLIEIAKAIEYLKKALPLLAHNDSLTVGEIIKTNSDKINYYNNEKLGVINPTNKELGSVNSSLKKIVLGHYSSYINKIKTTTKKRELTVEIYIQCSRTIIPEDVLNAKILLYRNAKNKYVFDEIETEINKYLKLKLLEAFNEQNKEFIKQSIIKNK